MDAVRQDGTPSVPGAAERLAPVDGLRGVAAIAVVLFHFLDEARTQIPTLGHPLDGFRVGAEGVQLFFVISGFVIFKTLRRASLRGFVASRISRLFPTYWVALLLTAAVVVLLPVPGTTVTVPQVLVNLTMLQSYAGVPNVAAVYWTLEVELAFYVQAALLWHLHAFQGRRLVPALYVWVVAATVTSLLVPGGPLDPAAPLGNRAVLQVTTYVPWFVCGIVGLLIWEGRRGPGLYGLLIVCQIAMLLEAPKEATGFEGLAFTALLLVVILVHPLGTTTRPLQYLGRISYSLYLSHQVVGIAIIYFLVRDGVATWLATAVGIAAALLIATLLTRWVERPLLRPVRGLIAGRSRDPAPTRTVGL